MPRIQQHAHTAISMTCILQERIRIKIQLRKLVKESSWMITESWPMTNELPSSTICNAFDRGPTIVTSSLCTISHKSTPPSTTSKTTFSWHMNRLREVEHGRLHFISLLLTTWKITMRNSWNKLGDHSWIPTQVSCFPLSYSLLTFPFIGAFRGYATLDLWSDGGPHHFKNKNAIYMWHRLMKEFKVHHLSLACLTHQ